MTPLLIRFIGPVRRPGPHRSLEIDPSGLQSVADLLHHLGFAAHELDQLTVLVDGARKSLDSPLTGALAVDILVAIGGG